MGQKKVKANEEVKSLTSLVILDGSVNVYEQAPKYVPLPGPVGPAGPQGAIGCQGANPGPQGEKGDPGEPGAPGPQGPTGNTGLTGPQGPIGLTGLTGPAGPAGAKGDKGDKGDIGLTGAVGPAGAKGDKGDKGDIGLKGDKGEKGDPGDKGDKGDQGDPGFVFPPNPESGDRFYFNGTDWTFANHFKGEYSDTVDYSVGDFVFVNDLLLLVTDANYTSPTEQGLLTFKGTLDGQVFIDNRPYVVGDVVQYSGNYYICTINDNNPNDDSYDNPVNSVEWREWVGWHVVDQPFYIGTLPNTPGLNVLAYDYITQRFIVKDTQTNLDLLLPPGDFSDSLKVIYNDQNQLTWSLQPNASLLTEALQVISEGQVFSIQAAFEGYKLDFYTENEALTTFKVLLENIPNDRFVIISNLTDAIIQVANNANSTPEESVYINPADLAVCYNYHSATTGLSVQGILGKKDYILNPSSPTTNDTLIYKNNAWERTPAPFFKNDIHYVNSAKTINLNINQDMARVHVFVTDPAVTSAEIGDATTKLIFVNKDQVALSENISLFFINNSHKIIFFDVEEDNRQQILFPSDSFLLTINNGVCVGGLLSSATRHVIKPSTATEGDVLRYNGLTWLADSLSDFISKPDAPLNGQLIKYDAAAGKWVNFTAEDVFLTKPVTPLEDSYLYFNGTAWVAKNSKEWIPMPQNPEIDGYVYFSSATDSESWSDNTNKPLISVVTPPAPSVPSGSVMLFYNLTAPSGWTQVTTHNDKALRVVSGPGAGFGGGVSFSQVMQSNLSVEGTVGGTTLTIDQIPSHTHTVIDPGHAHNFLPFPRYGREPTSYSNDYTKPDLEGSSGGPYPTQITESALTGIIVDYTGGGQPHTHTFSGTTASTLNIQYIDVILCRKD